MGGLRLAGDATVNDVLGERGHHRIIYIGRCNFPHLAKSEKPIKREAPLRIRECFR